MNIEQSLINGFVKRAAEHGIDQVTALNLSKHAFFGQDAMNKGMEYGGQMLDKAKQYGGQALDMGKQILSGPLASSQGNIAPGAGLTGIGSSMQPPYSGGIMPSSIVPPTPAAPAPQPAPVAPAPQGPAPIDWQYYHGKHDTFDPNSKMDRWKMQQLQKSQAQGQKAMIHASNQPYRGGRV